LNVQPKLDKLIRFPLVTQSRHKFFILGFKFSLFANVNFVLLLKFVESPLNYALIPDGAALLHISILKT